MDALTFDRLTKLASESSRRAFLRALIAGVMTARLAPISETRAQSGGLVVLGGTCTTTTDCEQRPPGMCTWTAVCGDNGFPSDGPLTCCTENCCQSDADCCGDLRCAPAYDIGSYCQQPPFPTRAAGQICTSHSDCLYWPGCYAECVNQRCKCTVFNTQMPEPPEIAYIPDSEAALAIAETVAALEVSGDFFTLYRSMHPDAQAIIPQEAVVGWYQHEFTHVGEPAPRAMKVRFISWTWPVTGKTYPETAEVVLRKQLADGTVIRDEIRLVKDYRGNWGWFFGRDRAFVEEQIARFT
jgi:hypothetical protein